MNYFEIANFIIVLVNLPMAIFLLLKSKGRKPNILLGLLCFAAVIWGIGAFKFSGTQSKELAVFWWQIANIGGILSTVIFYHFILSFLKITQKIISTVVNLLAIFFLYLNFFFKEIFIGDLAFLFNQFYYINFSLNKISIFLLYYFLFYFLLLSYSFYLLIKEYKSRPAARQLQMKYLILGMVVGFIGCHACFIPGFQNHIYPYLSILIAIYTIPIFYAIVRYNLMDINIIIKRSLVYTALITLITLFYLFAIYLTEHFVKTLFGYHSLFISLFFATFIALIFIPLKNLIQNIIEKTLFQGDFLQKIEENELFKKEIIRAEQMKIVSMLASRLAHEIKNPLTAIKTFTEYLPEKKLDAKFIDSYVRIVGQETERINNLVHELLSFAKPSTPKLEDVDIDTLINDILQLVAANAKKQEITIVFNKSASHCKLAVDPQQFKQAVLNILLNAFDAMPYGGTLSIQKSIRTKSEKQYLILTFSDTGLGIQPNDLPFIFDPFFSKKNKGTGLGLSVTHEIIKNHQGKIFVESKINCGTTFTIELPYNSPLL